MIAALKLLNTPPLALYQDSGRFGQSHLGLTQGGPIDQHAMNIANWLVHNQPHTCTIELTLGQFEARVLAPICIAVTGANVACYVNNNAINNWQNHYLKRGDTLKITTPTEGIRNYLAISSGVAAPRYFNSHASVLREQLGTKLVAKDILFCEVSRFVPTRTWPATHQPNYQNRRIRVVMGYQFDEFTEQAKNTFVNSPYTISPQSDRMGYRMVGAPITSIAAHRYSEGIALGAVQIPPDGQPIVLLNDRQTIGGYPKIGSVLSLDVALLGQKSPGQQVQFEFIDITQAQQLVKTANDVNALYK